MTSWLFGSRHDETVTHGRILDAVEQCRNSVNECATNIAVIHETLSTGSNQYMEIKNQVKDIDGRIKDLENNKVAIDTMAKLVWQVLMPTALAIIGLSVAVYQGAMWFGDRLDGDNTTHIEP